MSKNQWKLLKQSCSEIWCSTRIGIRSKIFNTYMRSQPIVFRKCGFKTSSFADDSNGMKTFSLTFQYNILKNDVAECIDNIVYWMNAHFLKINLYKTELILLHPKLLQKEVIIGGTIIEQQCVRFSDEVKNVGVWLDKNLKMDKHVNHIVSHCYKLLKDIGRIRNVLRKNSQKCQYMV